MTDTTARYEQDAPHHPRAQLVGESNSTDLLCCPKCKGDPYKTLDIFIRDAIPEHKIIESRYIECTCGIRFSPKEATDVREKIVTLWNLRKT